MENKANALSPYLLFNRRAWAQLRDGEPLTLQEDEIAKLQGINEELSMLEVSEIYLPLSRLLNLYIDENIRRQAVLSRFLGKRKIKVPYIIGIAGSVAVGKSTTSRVLQALLSRWSVHRNVALVTTDGFLYSNAELKNRGLMDRKGFPQSYDIRRLIQFVSDTKSGAKQVTAPVYSHFTYDVLPDENVTLNSPDILILEGLNVLQSGMDYPHDPHRVFVSDFVDFSIYVDAALPDLKDWYVSRFLKLRKSAFSHPDAYFNHYATLPECEAISVAESIWTSINEKNLIENILPTRERADLILFKSKAHKVGSVKLRK